MCYLRLDFESFDINGLSNSVERIKSTTTLTECQDTFKITVRSSNIYIIIDNYNPIDTYVHSMRVMCCNLFCSREQRPQLFLLFVEATPASMVSNCYLLNSICCKYLFMKFDNMYQLFSL